MDYYLAMKLSWQVSLPTMRPNLTDVMLRESIQTQKSHALWFTLCKVQKQERLLSGLRNQDSDKKRFLEIRGPHKSWSHAIYIGVFIVWEPTKLYPILESCYTLISQVTATKLPQEGKEKKEGEGKGEENRIKHVYIYWVFTNYKTTKIKSMRFPHRLSSKLAHEDLDVAGAMWSSQVASLCCIFTRACTISSLIPVTAESHRGWGTSPRSHCQCIPEAGSESRPMTLHSPNSLDLVPSKTAHSCRERWEFWTPEWWDQGND